MKALINYWVIRKKPHACFKVFQKAVKCHTRLDREGIKQILEAAKMTEDPYQVVFESVVPYLKSHSNTLTQTAGNSHTLTRTTDNSQTTSGVAGSDMDQEGTDVIKFFAETGFKNYSSYGEGVSTDEVELAKKVAKSILDISANISVFNLDLYQILYYSRGVLQLKPDATKIEDRQVLLEAFMHGWMDVKGDLEAMEKAVTDVNSK